MSGKRSKRGWPEFGFLYIKSKLGPTRKRQNHTQSHIFSFIRGTPLSNPLHPPQRKENDTLHAQTHTHTHERLST